MNKEDEILLILKKSRYQLLEYFVSPSLAWAAASRATGTRGPEQET